MRHESKLRHYISHEYLIHYALDTDSKASPDPTIYTMSEKVAGVIGLSAKGMLKQELNGPYKRIEFRKFSLGRDCSILHSLSTLNKNSQSNVGQSIVNVANI